MGAFVAGCALSVPWSFLRDPEQALETVATAATAPLPPASTGAPLPPSAPAPRPVSRRSRGAEPTV